MATGMTAGMAGEARGAKGNALGMTAGMVEEARGTVDDSRGMTAGIMSDVSARVVKVALAPGSPTLDPLSLYKIRLASAHISAVFARNTPEGFDLPRYPLI